MGTVLQRQAILLEKDKQIAAVSEALKSKHGELLELRHGMGVVDNNAAAMQGVVVEYEKIIAQIGDERSKEMRDILITKEKVKKESEQANEDLQAVDRALKDTLKKYERTKEKIGQMQDHENKQKDRVKQVQNKFRCDQDRYELLKNDANEKLSQASEKLSQIKNSKAAEILKLRTLLKKAELQVSSQEQKVEKLTKENTELTLICDELIDKCN